jgi:hypothetical protein
MSKKIWEITVQRNRGGTVSGDGGKILSHRALTLILLMWRKW